MSETNIVTSDTFLNRKVYQLFRKYTYDAINREELASSLIRLNFDPEKVRVSIKMKDEELNRLTKC
tara:strand:+ start:481 stop:678 length:198 start_codon:yes stop_codon:yes gene_type:complete